jgi:hypothetical protein
MTAPPSPPTRAALACELLRYKMMEYSEDSRCATWLVDLEFHLWHAAEMQSPAATDEYLVSLSKELRVLAEIAGGWWVYEDETQPAESGPVFITLERWQQILAERNGQTSP